MSRLKKNECWLVVDQTKDECAMLALIKKGLYLFPDDTDIMVKNPKLWAHTDDCLMEPPGLYEISRFAPAELIEKAKKRPVKVRLIMEEVHEAD